MREFFGVSVVVLILGIYWQIIGPELLEIWYWIGWAVAGVLGWLAYSFIAGGSLWSDARRFVPVAACAPDIAVMKLTSNGCQQYLNNSEKAKLQWQLEDEFRAFER